LVDAEDAAELDDPRAVPPTRCGRAQMLEIDEMEPRQPALRLEAAQLAQRVEEPQRRLLLAREEQQLDLAVVPSSRRWSCERARSPTIGSITLSASSVEAPGAPSIGTTSTPAAARTSSGTAEPTVPTTTSRP
jgi:hypothetical protein